MPEQRIALITGANKGLGYETARQLAAQGILVFLGARDLTRGREAAARLASIGDVRPIELDLTRPETLTAAAEHIQSTAGHLDILVNNAGIVAQDDGPPSTTNVDAVERIYATNVFGTLRATQALLPLVRKSADASIVMVSSGLGSLTQNGDPTWKFAFAKPTGYNSSKAALNMLTVLLAYELRDTQIKVNAADPGYTATDLNGNSGPQTVEEGATIIVKLAVNPESNGGYFDSNGPVPW